MSMVHRGRPGHADFVAARVTSVKGLGHKLSNMYVPSIAYLDCACRQTRRIAWKLLLLVGAWSTMLT